MDQTDRLTVNNTENRGPRVATAGHVVFAVTMIALGIFGLIKGNFTPTWSGVPKGLPGREVLAYLCAVISLVCGLGLLWHRTAAVAARVLLICFLVWLLLVRAPTIFRAPAALDTWWSLGDTAVMADRKSTRLNSSHV